MRKLLLALLCLVPLLSLADDFIIDETKSDIYFANSILMTKDKTRLYLRKIITENVLQEQYNGNSTKMEKELNFDINYNQTHGYYGDWYDTYMMLSSEEDGWKTLNKIMNFVFDKSLGKGVDKLAKRAKMTKQQKDLLDRFLDSLDSIDISNILDRFKDVRDVDLSRQVAKLQNSIRHGHGVIVLAHGKGDIFTAKAYEEMLKPDSLDGVNYRDNSWLGEYFQWMSIGSPSRDRIGAQPHVGFDNDSLAAFGILPTIKNPNRSQFENGAGEVAEDNEIAFHDFKYYMGEPVHIVDGYKDRDVSTDIAKNIIMDFIKNAINKHKTAQSQWVVDEEFNDGTKEYRITVKHIYKDLFLDNIMKDKKVFPFNPKNKLYQVADLDGELSYVKASFGGEKIVDEWEDKKESEFYKLEGTGEIIGKDSKSDYSVSSDFEIESGNDKYVYYSNDPIEMGAKLSIDIKPSNTSDIKDLTVILSFDAQGNKNLTSIIKDADTNATLEPFDELLDNDNKYIIELTKDDFNGNSYHKEIKINFSREVGKAVAPLKLTFKRLKLENSNDTFEINKSVIFVYAAVNAHSTLYVQGSRNMEFNVYFSAYCNPNDGSQCKEYGLNNYNAGPFESPYYTKLKPNENFYFEEYVINRYRTSYERLDKLTYHVIASGSPATLTLGYKTKDYLQHTQQERIFIHF